MRVRTRALRCTVGALVLAALAVPAPASALPPVRHVFVVFLENTNYAASFGPGSKAHYLNRTLVSSGQLLSQYYGIAHQSLPNYLAAISGQAPNVDTQADCQVYTNLMPGLLTPDGQAVGQGCVYPSTVSTVADQLAAHGFSWKGYMEDMGNDLTRDGAATCAHPQLGQRDPTQSAKVGDQYAARHNPFVYFHSIVDSPSCAHDDVPLSRLPADLADASRTPNFSFITPNLCNDGHDAPCVDGRPGGLVSADAWLTAWVPRILASPAFKRDGMLVITFDEAEGTPPNGDASACCSEPTGPNTPNPGGIIPGPGGGRIGAVVLSPYVAPGTVNATPYNHYSLLRSVEDVFGLSHLGYAAQAGLKAFGADVFNRPGGTPTSRRPTPSRPRRGSTGCQPRKRIPVRRGRVPRGGLVSSLRIVRGRRTVVALRFTHASRLTLRAARGDDARDMVVRRAAVACRTYRFTLPGRHGVLRVTASLRSGSERRTVRY